MTGYVKCFDSKKKIFFKVTDKKLSKKYTKIWERICSLMNIELNSKTVFGDNDKYVKTRIRAYGTKVKF